MGKQKSTGPRDMIVKFRDRRIKTLVYQSRLNMRRNENPIFINEDITPRRSKLFYDARKMKKSGKLHATWTQHGNIIIKVTESSKPQPVNSYIEMRAIVYGNNSGDDQSDCDSEELDELLSRD